MNFVKSVMGFVVVVALNPVQLYGFKLGKSYINTRG